VSSLEIIGALAVGVIGLLIALVLCEMIKEAARSWRQTQRICRVHGGKAWRSKIAWRPFLKNVWREWFSSYHTLRIGGIELPHDPWKPIKRRYWRHLG
jgi:hypothetical protein